MKRENCLVNLTASDWFNPSRPYHFTPLKSPHVKRKTPQNQHLQAHSEPIGFTRISPRLLSPPAKFDTFLRYFAGASKYPVSTHLLTCEILRGGR